MKLGKVIKYLENTLHLTLRLQADETNLLQWWVDAAYATHPDMKGHTGATFQHGLLICGVCIGVWIPSG